MKLTIQLQLLPTAEQAELLLDTMHHFNEAATFAARCGFDAGVFSQPSVHKLAYYEIRARFGLGAEMAVRAIGKAVECFSSNKITCPVFRPDGAVTYDQRNMSFKGLDRVSLSTLKGRQLIAIVYGEYQRERFDRIKGQCDLVRRDGKFYLLATIDLPEPPPNEVLDFVGVDLGIVSLATTDDGTTFTGQDTDRIRKRSGRARQTYQRRGTRNSRRRLRKMAQRQSRFQRNHNHCIAKQLVAKALVEGKGIAVEDLTGIRTNCEQRFHYKHRGRLTNWSFAQLRSFVEYKAKLAGVPVVAVDPRNTSKTCNVCGYCDKANRKTQGSFVCQHCGHSTNADQNGACNLRAKALAAQVNCRDSAAVTG